MSASTLNRLKSDLRPVQPIRPAWQYALGAICWGLAVLSLSIEIMGTQGWQRISAANWWILGTGFTVALLSSSWAAAQWLSPTGRGNLWQTLAAWWIAFAGLYSASSAAPYSLPHALLCFAIGSFFALLACLGSYLLFRRAAPQQRPRVALAGGLFSGFVGFLAVQVLCPVVDFGHLMTGHLLIPIFWGGAAYAALLLRGDASARP